ncbi:MAG: DUF72 domain-containing protein [Actinomycetota bacterium]|jgi:uncharacterized protein YecE (DUF72 family)
MGRILVGTASWTDESLIASGWYPEGTSSAEARLAYYASRFPLVEVDSTYYFLPRRQTAQRWVERTPDGFTFNVKAFSLLTQHPTQPKALPSGMAPEGKRHVYLRHLDRRAIDEIWNLFTSALAPLRRAGKLGGVLFQFPPWFTIKRDNKEYLAECAERAGPLRLCVEFRNAAWMRQPNRQETLQFLAQHRLAYVCVDTARRTGSMPPVAATTSPDLAVVRFHGRGRGGNGDDGDAQPEAVYSYTTRALRSWVPKLEALAAEAAVVHAVFRNVHRDFAPRSAERLRRLLEERQSGLVTR